MGTIAGGGLARSNESRRGLSLRLAGTDKDATGIRTIFWGEGNPSRRLMIADDSPLGAAVAVVSIPFVMTGGGMRDDATAATSRDTETSTSESPFEDSDIGKSLPPGLPESAVAVLLLSDDSG